MKKKYLALVPVLTMSLGLSVHFMQAKADETVTPPTQTEEETPTDMEDEIENYFSLFEGIVSEIRDLDDKTIVRLENEDGGVYDFIVESATVLVNKDGLTSISDIQPGDAIQSYFIQPQVMTMIYPPQLVSSVLVKPDEGVHIKVDYFDVNYLSGDGGLQLNVSEDTVITDASGNAVDGSAAEKPLIVFYTVTTRSLPPQTAPIRIIVLDAALTAPENDTNDNAEDTDPGNGDFVTAVPPLYMLSDEEKAMLKAQMQQQLDQSVLVVNGETLADAPKGYVSDDGVVMLPLRPVAEALGLSVGWDSQSKSITVGNVISLTVGRDYYTLARMAPIELGAAPEVKDGVTYVPILFFTEVIQGGAYMADGEIVIQEQQNQ